MILHFRIKIIIHYEFLSIIMIKFYMQFLLYHIMISI